MKKLDSILLIDDDDDDNEYHRIIITRAGICDNIYIAHNGLEALELLTGDKAIKPDLIFLDINMPRMNGWEFLEAYKALHLERKHIIILMLTTSINPADMKKAQSDENVTGYNSKPLNKGMLLEIIRSYFPEEKAGD